MFEKLRKNGCYVLTLQHAEAIVAHDIPGLAEDLENVLLTVTIPALELVKGGGGESEVTQRMRRAFQDRGWHKKNFEICKTGNGVPRTTVSHEIDQLKEFGDHTARGQSVSRKTVTEVPLTGLSLSSRSNENIPGI